MNIFNFLLKKLSFSNRPFSLIVALIIFFLSPIGVFILSARESYRLEIEKAQAHTQSLATAVARYSESVFESAENAISDLITLGNFASLNKMGNEKLSHLLNDLASKHPGIELMAMIDKNGNYLGNSAWDADFINQSKNAKSIAKRPHFIRQKEIQKDFLDFSDPITSNTTGNLVIVMSRKIPNKENQFKGIIVVAINIQKISQLFEEVGKGSVTAMTLWNNKRILFARRPYVQDQIGKYVPMNPGMVPMVQDGKKEGTYIGSSTVDTIPRIFSFQLMEHFPFHVVVGISTEEALRNWKRSVWITGIIGSSLAFLGLMIFLKYIGNIRRVNEQQALVVHSAKMASLGEMAAGISHEINNPLSIITGRAFQILSQLEREKADLHLIKERTLAIRDTAFRISKIIKGLRSFARDGTQDPMCLVSVSTIISNTLELCLQRFRSKGVEIEINLKSDFNILCREPQIAQVLLNLLNNAFDAVASLEKKWIKIEAQRSETQVTLAITDSGKGIPEEVSEKIMNPFFTTKPVGQGTGLGLSISKGIIEQHGGQLMLDRRSPNTRFIIELPLP